MNTLVPFRLLGAALLSLAGALLGLGRRRERQKRLRLLRELDTGLGLMAEELTALHTPLPQLFARLRDRPFFDLLHLGFSRSPGEADVLWTRAAEAQPLPPEEREILKSFAPAAGRYDADRQAAELNLLRRRLRERAALLETELNGPGKSLPTLGAALGALAGAVLF